MDLLRELKAMPVTLHLLQVGPQVSPAWESFRSRSWAPRRAPCPMPLSLGRTNTSPDEATPAFCCWSEMRRGLPGRPTLSLATEAPRSRREQ